MILRFWRARIRSGAEPELLARLREAIPRLQAAEEPLDFTYGFRHEAGSTRLMILSVWSDFPALLAATDGDLRRSALLIPLDDLSETSEVETFERLGTAPSRLDLSDGRVVGLVWGRAKPNHEPVAQSMIDRSAAAAMGAGAVASHSGRRLSAGLTDLIVVVVWPTRETMTRFVRSRDIPAIDPAFAAHLSDWRFETYDVLAPDRMMVPPDGPAVLVVDDVGRYVDATPGIEAVLGIPAEMLHGRSLEELGADEAARNELRQRFVLNGAGRGEVELLRPDGATVRVQYRTSAANVPGPGLHASVLALPGATLDPRPLEVILAEALPDRIPSPGEGRPTLTSAPAAS
jgi:PAS domain-containing protein